MGPVFLMSLAMTLNSFGEVVPASKGAGFAAVANLAMGAGVAGDAKNPLGLTPNVRELVETLDGPHAEPFPVIIPRSMLDVLEKEAVRRGRERVGVGEEDTSISARSRQSHIGETSVIITETLLMDYVNIVEIAGIIDGRLSTIICRNAPGTLSYIDYPTSECSQRANEHFGSRRSASNG